ncbi:MAG: glycoside hydrolase domain-containing protein [Candidatus Dormiibacterota bacterium]
MQHSALGQPVRAATVTDDSQYFAGFDTECDPSASTLRTVWLDTDVYSVGLYIGGVDMACDGGTQPNLNASYIENITDCTYGCWNLTLYWVGMQAPCSGWANQFSENTSTAFTQGEDQAIDAYNEAVNTLGMGTETPLTYDLEAYTGSQCNALAASESFIKGWDTQLGIAPAQDSGVYGSSCGSYLSDYTGSPPPVFIDGANWNDTQPNPDTASILCIPNGDWVDNQRLKQYENSQAFYGMSVDYDSLDGPQYAYPPESN